MFIIKDLIAERQNYTIAAKPDPWREEWLTKILTDELENETAFITIGSTLYDKKKIKALREKYNIVGVYNIGNIFANTSIQFYIVHLSKAASAELRIALYNGKCYEQQKFIINNTPGFKVPDSYTEEWETFITRLESWMNGGEIPEDFGQNEFGVIHKSDLYKDSYRPELYSKENIELRELLEKQDTRALSELTDILLPRIEYGNDKKVKVLKARNMTYPLEVSQLDQDKPTNIILQKGDVIIPQIRPHTKAYLFDYEGNEKIYASRNLIVIKCKKILPEYLYLYLISDVAVKVLNASCTGTFIQRISKNEIADLPIALPVQDKQKYIDDFNTLTHFGIRNYGQLQQMNDYFDHLSRIRENIDKPDMVEDIINMEITDDIRAYKEDQLRTFLSDDLKELNTCFRGKAYKAALIMAGSILEAVLIDWLSEIHHKNYFEEEYIVTDRNGREKRADLIDYINEIKHLRRPKWAEEANKAHEIRKKRNLVHAKLCLQSDEINEEVCREVISYLSDVLKTRGINSNPEHRKEEHHENK